MESTTLRIPVYGQAKKKSPAASIPEEPTSTENRVLVKIVAGAKTLLKNTAISLVQTVAFFVLPVFIIGIVLSPLVGILLTLFNAAGF